VGELLEKFTCCIKEVFPTPLIAPLVVGVDPSQFFLSQFQIIKHYTGDDLPIHTLPLKGEELPAFTKEYRGKGFDTVFSMGCYITVNYTFTRITLFFAGRW
jgi:hypothetical protein